VTLHSLHATGPAIDLPPRYRTVAEQLLARYYRHTEKDDLMFPTFDPAFDASLYADSIVLSFPSVPEFDGRLTTGARVKLTHTTRDEVHELTVRVLVYNGDRIVAVRSAQGAPRYNAADYELTILRPALPTKAGLYVGVDPADADGDAVYFHLNETGRWTRWHTEHSYIETTTAHAVGVEVGPAGLTPLAAVGK
jgi:hypothetical protein